VAKARSASAAPFETRAILISESEQVVSTLATKIKTFFMMHSPEIVLNEIIPSVLALSNGRATC
jgi:hypothetical protein